MPSVRGPALPAHDARALCPRYMRARLPHLTLLIAWLLATGVQWDALQAFAWSRMFSENWRMMPLREAVEFTFSERGMCPMCHAVQDAKQAARESNTPAGDFGAKAPVFVPRIESVVVAAPGWEPWRAPDQNVASLERAQPPAPPPRWA